MACQTAKPCTPRPDQFSHFAPTISNFHYSKNKKRAVPSRQSTLDKFVAKAGPPRPRSEEPDQDCAQGDEGVGYIDIDADAAKTWIYPGSMFVFFFPSMFEVYFMIGKSG